MSKQSRYYMQLPIPSGGASFYRMQAQPAGLNMRAYTDSGEITEGECFTSAYLPEIRPVHTPLKTAELGGSIISAVGIGGDIFAAVFDGENTVLNLIRGSNVIKCLLAKGEDRRPRSVVRFNVYEDPTAITGSFKRKILVFPDRITFDADIKEDFTPDSIPDGLVPEMDCVTVFNSRLFGVKDGRIYASAFNDYADFNLDTAEDYSEANAWMSETQSNPKAQNTFTAITVYDGHPVGFKADFMQQIYNTKNPFRITDIGEYGCASQKAFCQCLGALYFAASDGVYRYTGGYPQKISEKLIITDFSGAELAAFGDEVYMNIGGMIYTYAPRVGAWAAGEIFPKEYCCLVSCTDGVYIFGDGGIYKLRGGNGWLPMRIKIDRIAANTSDNKFPSEVALLYRMKGEGSVRVAVSNGVNTAQKSTDIPGMRALRLLLRSIGGDIHSIEAETEGNTVICGLQYTYVKGGNTYV